MKYFFVLFFLTAATIAFPQVDYRTTIIGPSDDINEFETPWAIQIYVDNTKTCSGVLINNEWVLTAAHCATVNRVLTSDIEIVAGTIYSKEISTTYESFNVDRIVINDAYLNGEVLKGDLALLHLSSPVTPSNSIKPIDLLSEQDFTDIKDKQAELFFYGWGKESNSSTTMSDVLKKTTNALIDTSNLFFKSLDEKTLGDSILLAYTESNSYVCGGDSGGPLIYVNENQQAILVGVIKGNIKLPFLIGCDGKVNVYQNVLRYESWINSVIQQSLETPPSFVNIPLGDTIYSCSNIINPVLQIINTSKNSLSSLNLQVVIYKDNVLLSTNLYKYTYATNTFLLPSTQDFFDSSNFNYVIDLEKEHFYKIQFSLVDENNIPFTDPIAITSIEKFFYFGKENSVLHLNSTTVANTFIWSQLLFSVYQEEDYQMNNLPPAFTKLYRIEDFKKSGTNAPYTYELEDSICLVKDCYYSTFEKQTQYTLFTKASNIIDTTYYYKKGSSLNQSYSPYQFWCINSQPCSISQNASIVQRGIISCFPKPNMLIPSITYNPNYTYQWFDVPSKSKISDNDTLLISSLNEVSLEITDRNNSECKIISYYKSLYDNLDMIAIRYSNNTLTALADVPASAGFIWFYNGQQIQNQYTKDLVPTLTGSYAVRYFTISHSDTCFSYFQSDDFLVQNITTKIKDPESDISITLFPNPSMGSFYISGLKSTEYSIEMYTVLGEKIFYKELTNKSLDSDIEIVLPKIPSGIYSITLSTASGTFYKKLILE